MFNKMVFSDECIISFGARQLLDTFVTRCCSWIICNSVFRALCTYLLILDLFAAPEAHFNTFWRAGDSIGGKRPYQWYW